MINRQLQPLIAHWLFQGKAIVLIGARQVGKTTLFSQMVQSYQVPVLHLNCDDAETVALLRDANVAELQVLIGINQIVVIDEAQRVPGIGMVLKRIIDQFPQVQLLVTGSSSLELQQELNEPLTGRALEFHLFPFTTGELLGSLGLITTQQMLHSRMIYGSYPDIINHINDPKLLLQNLSNNYLYRDLLKLESVRKPVLLDKLLLAMSLQIGNLISLNELAQTVGSDVKTVDRYIDLLEKCYIVFRLPSYSRNLRNELKKSKKIYFYDLGIRNAIISNFAPLELRQDVGALWENFFIAERIKTNHHMGKMVRSYFWRTDKQQEIDYIEEVDGQLHVFEMKWNPSKSSIAIPNSFAEVYKPATTSVVTPTNYMQFL